MKLRLLIASGSCPLRLPLLSSGGTSARERKRENFVRFRLALSLFLSPREAPSCRPARSRPKSLPSRTNCCACKFDVFFRKLRGETWTRHTGTQGGHTNSRLQALTHQTKTKTRRELPRASNQKRKIVTPKKVLVIVEGER